MLFKMVVKEREQGQGGLMKYLRFRVKRTSEKHCNKGVCKEPSLSWVLAEAGAKILQM